MGDTRWTPEPTTRKCVTCGSLGFFTSPLGHSRCSYCDGSEGGHPPTIGDLADRIGELEAKLATAEWLLVEASVQLRDGKMKTRRNRADLIDQFLTELNGEKT